MSNWISGVILFDETIRQKAKDGTPLVDLITAAGSIPGIKVDAGAQDLAQSPGEKVTEGLDGLRGRFQEYYQLGARFAKWRAVINIADHLPSQYCLNANAHALGALCGPGSGKQHRAHCRTGSDHGRSTFHRTMLRGYRSSPECPV